jgi:hypothetical protein
MQIDPAGISLGKPVAGRSEESALPVVHALPKAGILNTGRGLREIP